MDGREALIAELLGDFQKLLDRIDAVTPKLVKAQEGLEATAARLLGTVDPFRVRVVTMVHETQNKAVEHVVQQTTLLARRTLVEQTAAMKEAARTVFADEVTPPLRQLASDLQQCVREDRPWWLVWFTHAATAITSAACSTWLLATYMEHRNGASEKPPSSVEAPAPSQPASRPQTPHARK